MNHTIYIKNMVCPRCIEAVQNILLKNGINFISIDLGNVQMSRVLSEEEFSALNHDLENAGFALLNDYHSQLISQIKSLLIQQIQQENLESFQLSSFITDKLNLDYSHLSRLFSSVEGQTIEQFFILQKIEKVKELLTYNELTLTEISYRLSYSSPAHLSAQFRKVTGMSPSVFKNLRKPPRTALDLL